ncbi:tautomerase enzyme [Streptomyces sp. NBS 14/10]|uniref:tautomerase family protein n=1 Tax=Streptomyces sp. NBS 14/10 TaxID=1945643 RepID=UPI000B7ED383|nr:tautomerase enzyme [Streptomyces sp. NBS 14/10]KAK1184855.1 tautomerase enzyme [Streptomyces sp. NBS 14/10]NUP43985.1 tautomerase enzyme [Streptomyces sp.]NUS85846.1 tautomerase enzyme [Streptomyces sp.]
MTVITVNAPTGRLSLEQRRTLAETLTDAVLVPEVGQFAPAARVGFQVHFVEREPDMMAIGGRLLTDAGQGPDVMVIDVAVMDGDWRQEVRAEVIECVLAALAEACGLPEPSPSWWVNFRVIEEGSWGSGGSALSILSLLESGVFTEEKAKAIRAAIGA